MSRRARQSSRIAFFPRIWRQGRNYSTIVGWLLRRAFTGRHWQLAIAVVLSLLHLSSQAAAIYVVYWYGKQMEQTGLVTVPFIDLHVNLKDDPQWLWAIVAVSIALFRHQRGSSLSVAQGDPGHGREVFRPQHRSSSFY